MGHWTFPASTSCANTASINGQPPPFSQPKNHPLGLRLPTVYRCLGDHDTECPLCVRAHGVIQEVRRNNERLADKHDLFLADVKENGFHAVAAAFGRGVLNRPRIGDAVT